MTTTKSTKDTAVRERPILFGGAMVRAILEGRKTQTRRVARVEGRKLIGRRLSSGSRLASILDDRTGPTWSPCGASPPEPVPSDVLASNFCPFGKLGERLWVRETWSPDHAAFYPHWDRVYRATEPTIDSDIENGRIESSEAGGKKFPFRWRPSIHMPRRASRITLEITGVGVERLQQISPPDCVAEGVATKHDGAYWGVFEEGERRLQYREAFAAAWDALYTRREGGRKTHDADHQSRANAYRWDANPWVWVITFKRLTTEP